MSEKPKKHSVYFPWDSLPEGNMRLFPHDGLSGAASATECTGLIQVSPADEDVYETYDQVCSFRQERPIVKKDTE